MIGRALNRQINDPAVGGRVGEPDVLVRRDWEPVAPVLTLVAGVSGRAGDADADAANVAGVKTTLGSQNLGIGVKVIGGRA